MRERASDVTILDEILNSPQQNEIEYNIVKEIYISYYTEFNSVPFRRTKNLSYRENCPLLRLIPGPSVVEVAVPGNDNPIQEIRLPRGNNRGTRGQTDPTESSLSSGVTWNRKDQRDRRKGDQVQSRMLRRVGDSDGMVWVRCEPICGIWRYMLQASHNKLGACCALMGKVAGCKLRYVVLGCAHILPSFLPSFLPIF